MEEGIQANRYQRLLHNNEAWKTALNAYCGNACVQPPQFETTKPSDYLIILHSDATLTK